MAFLDERVVPDEVHQRRAPVEENGLQHGAVRVSAWRAESSGGRSRSPRSRFSCTTRRPRRHHGVRARGSLADPARLADRGGNRARGAPHRSWNRRLPQRHVRQRARVDHRALRRVRGEVRGRPRIAHGQRRRQPPARARLLAALRRPRRDRPRIELHLLRRSSPSPSCSSSCRRCRAGTATPIETSSSRCRSRSRSRCSSSTSRVTWFSLRRHRALHVSDDPERMVGWSFPMSLAVLGVATVVTALIAEILVGSIEVFAREGAPVGVLRRCGDRGDRRQRRRARRRGGRRLPREHQAGRRDRARLERSGRRLPDPAVALLALLIEPLALAFRPVEIAAVAGSVIFTALLLWGGRSSRLKGAALVVGYVVVAHRLPARRRPLVATVQPAEPLGSLP